MKRMLEKKGIKIAHKLVHSDPNFARRARRKLGLNSGLPLMIFVVFRKVKRLNLAFDLKIWNCVPQRVAIA